MTSTTDQVFAAFVKAQAEFLHIVEDAQVQVGGGSRAGYATLPAVIAALRPILNSHGLGLMQPAMPADKGVTVRTMLVHESGQSISDDGIYIPASKLDPQGHGSALSYARRYGVLSMLGVATNDDDGAAALQGIQRERQAEAQERARKAAAVGEREVEILCAIGKAVSPTTSDDRLHARYVDVLADDFGKTLEAGLGVAVKQKVISQEQADDIAAGAASGATAIEIRDILAREAVAA